jgi:mRNA interferase RelE/StbE
LAWTVKFDPRAFQELEKLDRVSQKRILKVFQDRLPQMDSPRDSGKAMVGDKIGLWRYRIGDFRSICRIRDEDHSVLVLRIAHRKDVYR